jgi:hypothetical protein
MYECRFSVSRFSFQGRGGGGVKYEYMNLKNCMELYLNTSFNV